MTSTHNKSLKGAAKLSVMQQEQLHENGNSRWN